MYLWNEFSHLPDFELVTYNVSDMIRFLRYRFGYHVFPSMVSGHEFRAAFNAVMGKDVGIIRIPQAVSKFRYETFDDIMA